MDINLIRKPTASTFEESKIYVGVPEVTHISYDLWILRITLNFEDIDNPVYVLFEGVCGFRVLDERDLLELWGKDNRADGWFWQIDSGGWFDLEKFRQGFVSGLSDDYTEYLILGINDCVSIIASDVPTIELPRP